MKLFGNPLLHHLLLGHHICYRMWLGDVAAVKNPQWLCSGAVLEGDVNMSIAAIVIIIRAPEG